MSESTVSKKPDEQERIGGGRGPAYPSISLREAISRVTQIKDQNAIRSVLAPETLFRIWGFKGSSGASRPILASINYYGLLDYIGRGEDRKVKVSELGIRIALDRLPESPARDAALREAALKPVIHQRLMERFPPPLPTDIVLEHFLRLDCGYGESVSATIVENFKDTLEYAGLTKPANIPSVTPESEKEVPPVAAEVGDLVQIEIGGTFQLEKPVRLRAIKEHVGQTWAFIEGTETGVPMEQVVVQSKTPASAAGQTPPPRLAFETPPEVETGKGEKEWLRGPLSKDISYRLFVSGELGPREIGKLIKLLEAQKEILSDEEEGDG